MIPSRSTARPHSRGPRRLRRALAGAVGLGFWLPALAAATPPSDPGVGASGVSVTPDPGGIPGVGQLHQLVNGLYAVSLVLALVGFVVASAAWGIGSHSNHYGAAHAGRRGVLVSAGAAGLIGLAPTLINFLYQLFHG
jgi:uncharacterized protein DUF6112